MYVLKHENGAYLREGDGVYPTAHLIEDAKGYDTSLCAIADIVKRAAGNGIGGLWYSFSLVEVEKVPQPEWREVRTL